MRPLGHGAGVGAGETAVGLRAVEIVLVADAALSHQERRPLDEQPVEARSLEVQRAALAGPGRDRARDLVDERLDPSAELACVERQCQQPHPAVDVVPDAARRDHAVGELGRGDPTDRKAVSLMDVGHRERRIDDPGERGDVLQLLQRPVAPDRLEQHVVGEHPRGDAHVGARGRGYLPERRAEAVQRRRRDGRRRTHGEHSRVPYGCLSQTPTHASFGPASIAPNRQCRIGTCPHGPAGSARSPMHRPVVEARLHAG